jgi:hypothetical protein
VKEKGVRHSEGECDGFECSIHSHSCDNSININGGKIAERNVFDIRNCVLG